MFRVEFHQVMSLVLSEFEAIDINIKNQEIGVMIKIYKLKFLLIVPNKCMIFASG